MSKPNFLFLLGQGVLSAPFSFHNSSLSLWSVTVIVRASFMCSSFAAVLQFPQPLCESHLPYSNLHTSLQLKQLGSVLQEAQKVLWSMLSKKVKLISTYCILFIWLDEIFYLSYISFVSFPWPSSQVFHVGSCLLLSPNQDNNKKVALDFCFGFHWSWVLHCLSIFCILLFCRMNLI